MDINQLLRSAVKIRDYRTRQAGLRGIVMSLPTDRVSAGRDVEFYALPNRKDVFIIKIKRKGRNVQTTSNKS